MSEHTQADQIFGPGSYPKEEMHTATLKAAPQGDLTDQIERFAKTHQRFNSLNQNLGLVVCKLRGPYADRESGLDKMSEPESAIDKIRLLNDLIELELEKLENTFTVLSQSV